MVSKPRFSRQKLVQYKAWNYRCTECGWATHWLDQIKKHVRQWSREGNLVPHYLDAGLPRKKEAK